MRIFALLAGVLFLFSSVEGASQDGKPAVVNKTNAADSKPVEKKSTTLRRFAITPRNAANGFPATAYEVPALVSKGTSPSEMPEYFFELKDTDGKVVPDPRFAFRWGEGTDAETADIPKETKELIDEAIKSVSRGTPSPHLYMNENGGLLFDGKPLRMVFGYVDEGDDMARPFPRAKQPLLFTQFAEHFVKVALSAAPHDLSTIEFNGWTSESEERRKFYFGVKAASGGFYDENSELLIQSAIAKMLIGKEDPKELTVDDKSGQISYNKNPLQIRFYYLTLDKEPFALVPELTQQKLQTALRRQAKWALGVQRAEEEKRQTSLADAGKILLEAENLFASKATKDKAKRIAELNTALQRLSRSEALYTKANRGEAETARKTARIVALRTDIDTAIDAATFPVPFESKAACQSFQLRQETRTSFSLNYVADPAAPKAVGLFTKMPALIECSGSNAVVYARWKRPEGITVNTRFDLKPASQLTKEELDASEQPVVLFIQGDELKLALNASSEDGITSVKFEDIGPGIAGVRIAAESNPYHRYEFPLDGSFYRTRLVVDHSNSEFAFFLKDDNTVQIVQNMGGAEVLKATVRGFDAKTATAGSKSLVFKASSVLAAKDVTVEAYKAGLSEETSSSTVFLLNQTKITPVVQDSAERTYSSIAFDDSSKKFQLRADGDAESIQEISLNGPLLRRRLTLPDNCDKRYRIIVSEDGITSLYAIEAEEQVEVARLTGLGQYTCDANTMAFLVDSLTAADASHLSFSLNAFSGSMTPEKLAAGKTKSLVILNGTKVTTAWAIPPGIEVTQLKMDDKASVGFGVKWGEVIPVAVSPKGEWSGAQWLGLNRKHSLLFSQAESHTSLLFFDGKPMALFRNVRSAASMGDYASVVASHVTLSKEADMSALKKTYFSVQTDAESKDTSTAFTFENEKLIAKEGDPHSDEGGITAVELVARAEGAIWRKLHFKGNLNYSALVEMKGQRIDIRPASYDAKKAYEWKSGPLADAVTQVMP